jgi:YbbR domain-containing protein
MTEEKRKSHRNFLKVVSLVFSFVLWIYVIGTADTQLDKNVTVRYLLPSGKAIVSEDVKEVTFHLTGPRAFIRTIQDKEEFITIDLTKRRKKVRGEYEVSFKPTDLSLPFGVKVNKIEPSKVYLEVEKAIIKKVPVKFVAQDELSRDKKIISSKIEPKFISIQGPFSVMKEVEYIPTNPIALNELKGEGELDIEVLIDDDRLVRVDDQDVRFVYEIKASRANLLLKDIPIKFLTPATKSIRSAQTRNVNLMVFSESGDEADVDKSKIDVVGKIPVDAKGKIQIELKATLPDGVSLQEIQPNKVIVDVR